VKGESGIKTLCHNSKARFSYEIIENHEAGIVLSGSEVKSLRSGGASLKDSYAVIKDGEMILVNLHINPYLQANIFNHEPRASRKLLLHKREILRLSSKVKEKGLTLIPMSIYLKGSRIKVDIGLAKGKTAPDKKSAIKERDVKREMQRELKNIRR